MQIVIPFLPPSVNRCYRSYKSRVYKSKVYNDFITQMGEFLDDRDDGQIKGKVMIDVTFYKKDKRNFDLDNRLKSLLDCIEDKLIENDNYVCEIKCRKFNGCIEDKTLLIITSMEGGQSNVLVIKCYHIQTINTSPDSR